MHPEVQRPSRAKQKQLHRDRPGKAERDKSEEASPTAEEREGRWEEVEATSGLDKERRGQELMDTRAEEGEQEKEMTKRWWQHEGEEQGLEVVVARDEVREEAQMRRKNQRRQM